MSLEAILPAGNLPAPRARVSTAEQSRREQDLLKARIIQGYRQIKAGESGVTLASLADSLGISVSSLSRYARQLQLTTPKSPALPDTEEINGKVRALYRRLQARAPGDSAKVDDLAKELGCRVSQIYRRAQRFGITTSWLPVTFSGKERAIIQRCSHYSAHGILRELEKMGFSGRTKDQINKFRHRLQGELRDCRADKDVFTPFELAPCLGVDSTTITGWVRRGYLRGTAMPGDKSVLLIREADLRRFCIEHPLRIPLGKVDAAWFIPFLAGHKGSLAKLPASDAGSEPVEFSLCGMDQI